MKFTLTRTVALWTLKQALQTCNTKAKNSADSDFLFQEKNGQLYVSSISTTAEQTIALPCDDLEADEKEGFTVSGQAIVELINSFKEEEIEFIYNSGTAEFLIQSLDKKSKFLLPTGDIDSFIPYSFTKPSNSFNISGKTLSAALKHTAFCVSVINSDTPYTAVKLKLDGKSLSAESTDKHFRLSSYQIEIDDINHPPVEFLLPRETAIILSKLLENVDDVLVRSTNKHVRLEWDDVVFTTSLENSINKPFNSFSAILSKKEVASAKISKGDLLSAVKMISMLAKDSSVVLNLSDKGLKISALEKDRGAAQLSVTTQEQDGKAEIRVVCKYLHQGLESITEPWVILSFIEISTDTMGLVLKQDNYEHLLFRVLKNDDEDEEDNVEETDDEENED